MVRHEKGEHARVTVEKGQPTMAPAPQRCADARVSQQDNAVVRAFSTLFS